MCFSRNFIFLCFTFWSLIYFELFSPLRYEVCVQVYFFLPLMNMTVLTGAWVRILGLCLPSASVYLYLHISNILSCPEVLYASRFHLADFGHSLSFAYSTPFHFPCQAVSTSLLEKNSRHASWDTLSHSLLDQNRCILLCSPGTVMRCSFSEPTHCICPHNSVHPPWFRTVRILPPDPLSSAPAPSLEFPSLNVKSRRNRKEQSCKPGFQRCENITGSDALFSSSFPL